MIRTRGLQIVNSAGQAVIDTGGPVPEAMVVKSLSILLKVSNWLTLDPVAASGDGLVAYQFNRRKKP